jgi:hypothetical protein
MRRNDLFPARKLNGYWFALLFFLPNSSAHYTIKTNGAALIIHFRAYVHGEPLKMNKKYQNPFGETFEISRFRFYVGKIEGIHKDTARKMNVSSYRLIDFSDSSSTYISLPATTGTYNGIQFLLGVDSTDQNRGAQTGVLDPIRGMFWTWNTGYVTFKIEGYSPESGQPAHMIAYHIGGYHYPFSTVWKIKLDATNEEPFIITGNNKVTIEVSIELDQLFDGTHPLRIKEISACTSPGDLARKISENFIGSFTGLTLIQTP